MTGFTSRLPWSDLPVSVRHSVDTALDTAVSARVVSAQDVHGGMSTGPAAVLLLDDGRQLFIKLVTSRLNQRSQELYRYEISAYGALAPLRDTLPMPELVAVVDQGSWLGLLTTLAPGSTPGPPWNPEAVSAVSAVAAGCDVVAAHLAPDGVPPVLNLLPDLDGWAALQHVSSTALDDWDREYAPRAARAAQGWRQWTAGSALAHHDVRCDNVLVDGTRATFVDWAFASAAATWLDRALLACDLVGSGVGLGASPDVRPGAQTPTDAVTLALAVLDGLPEEAARLVVAQVGMMRRNSLQPDKPGMPTFRGWQAARAHQSRPLVEALLPQLGC